MFKCTDGQDVSNGEWNGIRDDRGWIGESEWAIEICMRDSEEELITGSQWARRVGTERLIHEGMPDDQKTAPCKSEWRFWSQSDRRLGASEAGQWGIEQKEYLAAVKMHSQMDNNDGHWIRVYRGLAITTYRNISSLKTISWKLTLPWYM